jgi:hypothetical protein
VHDTSERVDHQARAHAVMTTGEVPANAASLRRWDELSDEARQSCRVQARRIGENLAAIGCFMVPAFDPALEATFDDDEVWLLARLEYERWMGEKIAQRVANSPEQHDYDDAEPLPWDELPYPARIRYLQAARRIPVMVARAGFQVLRGTPHDLTDADFTGHHAGHPL